MSRPPGKSSALQLVLALLVLFAVGGCPTTPEPVKQEVEPEHFPSIAEIRSKIGRRAEERVKGPVVEIAMNEVSFPRTVDVAAIWTDDAQSTISPKQLQRWQANGLQIAVIKRRQARHIYNAIPQIYVVTEKIVVPRKGSPEPTPFQTPLKHTSVARYFVDPPEDLVKELVLPPATLDPETNDTVVQVRPGEYRFLIETEQMLLDKVLVKVTPQCHWLEPRLRPRPPFETVTDGKVFEEMSVSLLLDRADMLVIGYNPMPPLPEPKEELPDEAGQVGEQVGEQEAPLETQPDERAEAQGEPTMPEQTEDVPPESEPAEESSEVTPAPAATETAEAPADTAPAAEPERPARDEAKPPDPLAKKKKFVPMPRIGERLVTFDYDGHSAQMLIFITPEVHGQVLDQPVAPQAGEDPNVQSNE